MTCPRPVVHAEAVFEALVDAGLGIDIQAGGSGGWDLLLVTLRPRRPPASNLLRAHAALCANELTRVALLTRQLLARLMDRTT